ncbi:hypothetical protein K438DRAFT_1999968 [Mycena galopus ATCC 62051]|nr:hypothetical protein K438DRAFT_1999968 [Mycena galopus ATCC 62051]
MSWNIIYNFTLKLTDPEFQVILRTYDIMFFSETDMLPGEEENADVPVGYTLISLPRQPRLRNQCRGGGVALLIRNTFTFTKSELSSDILVLDMGSLWLIGAYITPESSRWEGLTDIAPLDKFWETVALCTPSNDKYLPIGHTTATMSPPPPPRPLSSCGPPLPRDNIYRTPYEHPTHELRTLGAGMEANQNGMASDG